MGEAATGRPDAPAAPPCPSWCADPGAGWDVSPAATSKLCELAHEPTLDVDGEPVAITLHRFAELVDGQVAVEDPTLSVRAHGRLDLDHAQRLGQAILDYVNFARSHQRAVA